MGERSLGCSYDREHITACWRQDVGYPKQEASLSWANGHVQTIESGFDHIALTYDSNDVVRVDFSFVTLLPGPGNTRIRQIADSVATRITLTYDNRHRLIREDLARGKDLDWVVATTYSYDADGNLATRRNNDEATSFTYRKDGRLARVDTINLTVFDESGKNTRRTIQFEYDALGRLIADVDHWGDPASTRTYDYECR